MGLYVQKGGAKGLLEGCVIWGNQGFGVCVNESGNPTLVGCTIRDHAVGAPGAGSGCGVYVDATSGGRVTLGLGTVFARNAGGDVVMK